ncbi:MAG: mandelate racemase [Actinobacteria bacterium]|nr:mandelate racemase [Actinomycetota bacterium]
MSVSVQVPVESVDVAAYEIPTDAHESDGTLQWDSVTCVVVQVSAGDHTGLGYTYAHQSAATLIADKLADVVIGRDALQTGDAWAAMVGAIRNLGRPGIASTAISAVDIALWDLKGRLLDAPVTALLGAFHDGVEVYGSGGFTSYPVERLCGQLAGWVEQGIPRVKMKVGRDTPADPERVAAARAAVGDDVELYVDANGAWTRKQALAMAWRLAEFGVRWLEEPVTSDDPEGLRLLRDRGPGLMDIAAGEYGYDLPTFRDMLAAGAVDCLQADVTRCGGVTGFQRVGALCDAHTIDLSAHCAPSVSAHVCAAQWHFRHIEYFHDHVRIERMLFDGRPELVDGCLVVDRSRPGIGLELKRADAEQYRVAG